MKYSSVPTAQIENDTCRGRHIERHVKHLSDGFGRECLATARWGRTARILCCLPGMQRVSHQNKLDTPVFEMFVVVD